MLSPPPLTSTQFLMLGKLIPLSHNDSPLQIVFDPTAAFSLTYHRAKRGEAAAECAEAILEWMDALNKAGNMDVKPDTITFISAIDAW